MHRVYLVVLLLSFVGCRTVAADDSDVRLTAKLHTRMLADVTAIALSHSGSYPDDATQKDIKALLPAAAPPYAWARLAKLFWAMRSGLAEHNSYDTVYEVAQWYCLEQLANTPGHDAGVILEHILKPVMGSDGHPSELFSELIARQRGLTRR